MDYSIKPTQRKKIITLVESVNSVKKKLKKIEFQNVHPEKKKLIKAKTDVKIQF